MHKLTHTLHEITVSTDEKLVNRLLAPYQYASVSGGFHYGRNKEVFFSTRKIFFVDFEFEDLDRQTNVKFCFLSVCWPTAPLNSEMIHTEPSHQNLLSLDISKETAASLFDESEQSDFLSKNHTTWLLDRKEISCLDIADTIKNSVSDVIDKYIQRAIFNVLKHKKATSSIQQAGLLNSAKD